MAMDALELSIGTLLKAPSQGPAALAGVTVTGTFHSPAHTAEGHSASTPEQHGQ